MLQTLFIIHRDQVLQCISANSAFTYDMNFHMTLSIVYSLIFANILARARREPTALFCPLIERK